MMKTKQRTAACLGQTFKWITGGWYKIKFKTAKKKPKCLQRQGETGSGERVVLIKKKLKLISIARESKNKHFNPTYIIPARTVCKHRLSMINIERA